jgi:hypothetical protein
MAFFLSFVIWASSFDIFSTVSCILFFLLLTAHSLVPADLIRHDSRAHHDAERKTNLYGPLRAILPAGTAMPAFLRILYVGFVLLVIHINHIQRAGILTGSASGAEFLVN